MAVVGGGPVEAGHRVLHLHQVHQGELAIADG
jgi:hypothetical protein